MYMNTISFLGKMFTTDLDGTLLIHNPDNLNRSVKDREYDIPSLKKAEYALKQGGFDTVLINTGRNFSELEEVEDILKNTEMPIESISLQDGKRLLNKPNNLTPKEWMAQLFDKNINYLKFEDKCWAQNNEKPLEIIGEYLTKEKGFILRKKNNETIIYSKPRLKDENNNEISRWEVSLASPEIQVKVNTKGSIAADKKELMEFSSKLTQDIKNLLDKEGYSTKVEEKEETAIVTTFERKDINKASVANYVKNKLGDSTEEVRAGDSENDIPMLVDDGILAVQVGENKKLNALLKDRENVINVPSGDLGYGITQCAKRLNYKA